MKLASSNRFIPRQYDLFAGMDVDKKSISMTFMDHDQMIKSVHLPSSGEKVLSYVRRHFPGQQVAFAYEAGGTGFGLYDQITAEGFPCLVTCPSLVPTAPGDRVKTNRRDSQKISLALRGGQLTSIHVPAPVFRELRHLSQLRDACMGQVIAFKSRVKALLLYEGIPFPALEPNAWSKAVLEKLKQIPCSAPVRFKLDRLLAAVLFNKQQVLETQREIRRFVQKDPGLLQTLALLRTIPGIGEITAIHLIARIGDWRQIQKAAQLPSFLGLVPRENSTGTDVRKGPITRSGDRRLRSKMIQAAWAAIRQEAELRDFYRRIYQRHPRDHAAQKAIVAVARKLAMRAYSVLKEQRPYVSQKSVRSHPLTAEEIAGPGTRLDVVAEVE